MIIDGPPGCGKTTLLRMLALRLANRGRKVAYLSCATLGPEATGCSLLELVKRFGINPDGPEHTPSETVLVVDALDESPFDVSPHIEKAQALFANIVISCRNAYATKLRSVFPRISLSPFTDEERAEFLEKWFRMRPELVKRATELIGEYRDLGLHTRLPLIATILVTLLENGVEPRTRADIYGMRLDLLLSRWDKSRGVRRFEIDNPDAKRRFLRKLAYNMHAASNRARLIKLADLHSVYESSLGKWGYDQNFQDMLNDLVVNSGLLIEERADVFSFGHLSFQEHLTGEYLAHSCHPREVAKRFWDDWWREPLNFYACIKGDITEFADELLNRRDFGGPSEQLAEMLRYAPYTSAGVIEAFARESAQEFNRD